MTDKKKPEKTAIVPAQPGFFTPEQESIILRTFLGGASRDEAQVLLATVQRRRLDPFRRQVYFVKRGDRWAIQTSIDGLRSIAERTGQYDGQDEPEFTEDHEGKKFCRVRVWKKGVPRPFVGIAYFEEYVVTYNGKPTDFWRRMPHVMIAKCAEALALRKAFPEDTGGLYVAEEIGVEDAPTQAAEAPKATVDEVVEKIQAKPLPLSSPAQRMAARRAEREAAKQPTLLPEPSPEPEKPKEDTIEWMTAEEEARIAEAEEKGKE